MEGSVKGIKWIDGQSESKRMTRTQKETPLSLSELIDAFQPEAYRYSVMLMGNREDAWDLMQETWILVYQKLPGLKNPDCFKSWFYQILTRNSWKMKRKTSRAQRRLKKIIQIKKKQPSPESTRTSNQ